MSTSPKGYTTDLHLIGDPFKTFPWGPSTDWATAWNDAGSGGGDWGFWYRAVQIPGYGVLGDVRSSGRSRPSTSNTNGNQLLVRTDRPDAAVKCTGYASVGKWSSDKDATGYLPTHPDTNYVAVGLAIRRNANGRPPIGEYYLINKAYLVGTGEKAIVVTQADGTDTFRTIIGSHLFLPGNFQYTVLDDKMLKNRCMGSVTDPLRSPGSDICRATMRNSCDASSIKIGGGCFEWCKKDPLTCDAIKSQFCTQHPTDPWCDCILATKRSIYTEEINKLKPASRSAPKACITSLCKDRTNGHDVFMFQSDQVALENCPPIYFEEHSVNVGGTGNIVDVVQQSGTPAVDGSSQNQWNTNVNQKNEEGVTSWADYWWVLLVLIAAILLGAYFFDDDEPYQSTMQYNASNAYMQQHPQSPYLMQPPPQVSQQSPHLMQPPQVSQVPYSITAPI